MVGGASVANKSISDIDLIEDSAKKAQLVSGVLFRVFTVLFWLSIIAFSAISILMVISGIEDYSSGRQKVGPASFAKMLLEALLICGIILIIKRSFGDIAQGNSPFSRLQAKRLRIVAVLLLAHALLTTIVSPGILSVAGTGEATVGVAIGAVAGEADKLIPINAGDIVLAVVLFCAALIVEYGSLLQQLSDDTL